MDGSHARRAMTARTRLTLIHTVGSLMPVFAELTGELLPGVETTDIVDEALLGEAIAAGEIPAATAERLGRHIGAAVDAGADLVLVTCSSMGPVVDRLRASGLPVVRIDDALADAALAAGSRIGVIATLPTTLGPTADLVRRRALALGRPAGSVEIVSHLCEGAFAALRAGDPRTHDAAVRDGLRTLLPRVDAIVLAQASMARVAGQLDPGETAGTPILASPRLGIERVAELLASQSAGDVTAHR
jgi:Asp/Glu/hydantoin racemase